MKKLITLIIVVIFMSGCNPFKAPVWPDARITVVTSTGGEYELKGPRTLINDYLYSNRSWIGLFHVGNRVYKAECYTLNSVRQGDSVHITFWGIPANTDSVKNADWKFKCSQADYNKYIGIFNQSDFKNCDLKIEIEF